MLVLTHKQKAKDEVAKLVAEGRRTGKFRFGGLSLREVPVGVYNQEPLTGVAFWEETAPQTLDLSRNEILSLPEGLSNLVELESLNISHNQLISLPTSISSLSNLSFLDFSHNKLTRISAAISTSLQRLDCKSNQLEELESGALPRLRQLSADNNKLQKLPECLAASQELLKLSLAANSLDSFPQLQGFQQLEELDLSANHIQGPLPGEIGSLKSLCLLNIRQNRLSQIPPEISKLTRLLDLNLSMNQIAAVPVELASLTQLNTLDLSDNVLEMLPEEIGRLSLGMLDLRNNRLSTLPPQLGLMTSLKALPVRGNPLRGFRPKLLEGPLRSLLASLRHRLPVLSKGADEAHGTQPCEQATEAVRAVKFTASKTLSLAGMGLETIPHEVWELEGLEIQKLDLSRNSLADFPSDRLAAFGALRTLLLAGNSLSCWPLPVLGAPLSLEELDVSGALRGEIPPGALSLCSASITALKLSGVRLRKSERHLNLQACSKLQRLGLDGCSLDDFPSYILELQSLKSLNLAANALSVIPEDVTQLTALTFLSLANNSISSLPPKLGLLGESLRVLELGGNPLRTVRRPVLERGTKAVLACLRDRIPV